MPPLNLATWDLIFRSSEKLQLLPISSGIAGAHSSGEKSQTISHTVPRQNFIFPPCVQSKENVCFTVFQKAECKLFVWLETRIKHPSTIFRSHILIY